MGGNIKKLLRPSEYVGEYSIGADIVKSPPNRLYVQGGAEMLRSRSAHVIESESEDDKKAVNYIKAYFGKNDYCLAKSELNHTLDTPLRQNVMDWMAHATDHDIEMFCKWSLMRTRDLTHSLHRDKTQLIDHTLDKTHNLADIGLFPPTAIPVMEAATDRYYIQGIDSFHSGGLHRIAFCDDYTIGMANLYLSRPNIKYVTGHMKRTIFHEYMHGAGNDRGFFWGISTQLPVLRIIEEAFVEHSTSVAHAPLFKRPHIVNPKDRLYDSGVYGPERTFLATAMDHAGIAVEHLSEAFFCVRGDERGESLRKDIEQKIGKFFGSSQNFFEFVDDYEHTNHVERPSFIKSTLARLVIPARPDELL